MVYGFRSRRKSAASTYRRTTIGVRTPFARRNLGKTKYFQSATTRRLNSKETKYDDDYFNLNAWTKYSSISGGPSYTGAFTNWVLGGVLSTSVENIAAVIGTGAQAGQSALVVTPSLSTTPNCLTNITSGTTASTRIGNKVEPKYITIKGVCTAGTTTNPSDSEAMDKLEAGTSNVVISRYCRTTMRILIVRDKSMNEKGYVEFTDMFAPPSEATLAQGPTAAVNPFLWNRKLDTIGRYEILKQSEFTMDQTDPQKAFNWTIPLKGIGIRFNGAVSETTYFKRGPSAPDVTAGVTGTLVTNGIVSANGEAYVGVKVNSDAQSMTNGIYILAVAHSGDTAASVGGYASPAIMFSTRCGFYDN